MDNLTVNVDMEILISGMRADLSQLTKNIDEFSKYFRENKNSLDYKESLKIATQYLNDCLVARMKVNELVEFVHAYKNLILYKNTVQDLRSRWDGVLNSQSFGITEVIRSIKYLSELSVK